MSQTAVIGHAAESFAIEGGRALHGRIRAAGNKNGALPILAACLLTSEPVTLRNIPRIVDVETMLELLDDVGADADWTGANEVQVHAADVNKQELDEELCSRMRASFLLAGPLLARLGAVSVPPPGGDVIGRRRLDPHIHALGSSVRRSTSAAATRCAAARSAASNVFLDEASVMATENAVMAAALTQGETVIGNAACEPHVQDLCRFLRSLGAQIEGIESNVLRIEGVESLDGGEWEIGPDHIEVGSFIGLAAITGSDVTIDGVEHGGPVSVLHAFEKLGVAGRARGTTSFASRRGRSSSCRTTSAATCRRSRTVPGRRSLPTSPPIALTVATQADGTMLIFEKMFENRLFFTDKLVSMGARIILCDPHRAVVTGPSKLRGQRMESPDIRAGMAMLLASLCAEGSSTIGAVYQIDKGYERIDERLRALGAQIERDRES